MAPFLSLLTYPLMTTAVLVVGIMIITWLIALLKRNAGVVDIAWGIAIALVAFIAFLMGDGDFGRRFLLLFLVGLWALRLTSHLFFRFLSSPEDKRYHRMREKWGDQADLNFLFVFLFQGFLILCLTIPFFAVSFNVNPSLSWVEWLGALITVVGIIGEGIADWQLSRFKSKRENQGKVLESGLWGLSRHPNYFFEWIVWVGLAIFAFASPFGWIAIFSAGLMLYLLLALSGIPLTEQEMLHDRGPAYTRYQKEVSSFFPWPRHSSSS